jgi:hypothetical protein
VVCTGVKFDWGKIAALKEALGHGGVCSNYSPDHVGYTWECIKALKPGGRAVFTQPPLPSSARVRHRKSSTSPPTICGGRASGPTWTSRITSMRR